MNYEQALDYLASLNTFGINLGLSRINKLLDLMQHPERRFKSIHVTGTNGKGSTTAMLSAIFKASGIKAGMYTSPHLSEYTERIVVDSNEISKNEFAQALLHTKAFVEQMANEGFEHPTEFEVLTAAAFYYFAAAGVEYAVIEVGLGGLLDSTNVIMPELAVITNVTLDHTDKCGTTIGEIARHKAGIIKEGIPVVTGAKGEALAVIRETCGQKQAPLYVLGQDFDGKLQRIKERTQLVEVCVANNKQVFNLVSGLLGFHQVENSALAVMVMAVLMEKDSRITAESIKCGAGAARWPARFEIFPGQPVVILDGAHNPAGAKVLRENLARFFPDKEFVFVLGILRDKDADGILSVLISPEDQVVAVRPVSDRALEPEELALKIKAKHVVAVPDIRDGIAKARQLAKNNGVVCIAGSLYLAGAARQIIVSK